MSFSLDTVVTVPAAQRTKVGSLGRRSETFYEKKNTFYSTFS